MKNPIVSVIIPCFNREKYIKKCVDSISKQTLKNIEIIVVDDGSTDNSAKIVKELQKDDSRIILIKQKQSGVSTARNQGLKKAKGKYIMWCDSDDYFDTTMCQKMVETLENEKVDIVACGMKLVYTDGSNQKDIEDYVKLKFSGKQKLDFEKTIFTDVSTPTKIFKKSIIEKYKMKFPDGLHFEDAYFCDQYFSVAKTIFYLDDKLYNYVRHSDSIMSKSFQRDPIALDYIQIIPLTYNYLKKNKIFKENTNLFWHRFIQYYAFTYDNAPILKVSFVKRWAKQFVSSHEGDLILADENIRNDVRRIVRHRFSYKEKLYNNKIIRLLWERAIKPIVRR